MKITSVTATVLRGSMKREYWGRESWSSDYATNMSVGPSLDSGYPIRWRMRHHWTDDVTTCLVRITTDEGIEGVGEAKGAVVPTVAKALIDEYLAQFMIGQDPFHTSVLWDRLRASMRGRGHTQGFHQEAAAGIDIALWDLKGKAAGRPVCDLLGGRYRDRMRVYYSAVPGITSTRSDEQRQSLTEHVENALSRGFSGVKIAIGRGRRADIESVKIVREVAGDELLVLADALGSYDYGQSLRLAHALAELGVEWLEAPLPTEDLTGYVELSKVSPIPIANDVVWTLANYREMLACGAKIIVQPEVIKIGITECAQIAALADTFGCAYAPHVSIGSAIQFVATTHLAVAAPNFIVSEYWGGDNPLGDKVLTKPLEFVDSALVVPDGPGLGVELDEEAVSNHAEVTATQAG